MPALYAASPHTVLLIGGSGFVGAHLASQLIAAGYRVRVPVRNFHRARHCLVLPNLDLCEADVNDAARLLQLMRGVDTVINLVGVLHSPAGKPYGPAFRSAHVDLPGKIVRACEQAGVKRLLHMSALGASSDAPSEYLRSKAAGEALIAAAPAALQTAIFRPSVIFGPQDKFLNLFAKLQEHLPVLFLTGAEARFQPVYINDVCAAILASMQHQPLPAQAMELAGPKVYSLRELVDYVGELTGFERPVIALGNAAGMLQAAVLECLPGPLMSRDNVRSMQRDNVARDQALPFGMQATALEAIAPGYLQRNKPSRFDLWRKRARRS